jgi:hypothetical protein
MKFSTKSTTLFPHSVPALTLSLLFSALALAGCAPKKSIVGKWQGAVTQRGGTMNTTFEFTPDGKENVGIQGGMGAFSVNMGASGTYTVTGSNLTQTLTAMTFGGRTVPVPAGQAQPQTNGFTLDGDHLTLSNPSSKESLTLTRVKE